MVVDQSYPAWEGSTISLDSVGVNFAIVAAFGNDTTTKKTDCF
jgi:hypothetical protein